MNHLFIFLCSILLLSCSASDKKSAQDSDSGTDVFQSLISGKSEFPEKLSPPEYVEWVKEQKGITYNSVRNDRFLLNLIFNPPQLEAYNAALTNGENPQTRFADYLEIRKGYYYCTAECVITAESAANPIKKTDLLQALKQNLVVVKNNTDTLPDIITEAFPSYVLNQPNKLLILIPNTDAASSYRITVSGAPFNLNDCTLNLSAEHIKSFPLIKL